MGLFAKSSAGLDHEQLPSFLFSQLALHLAETLIQLACTRLTAKQRQLIIAADKLLRRTPQLSLSALADRLSRNLNMPFSTVKFNLRVLREAGLLVMRDTQRGKRFAALSWGGELLAGVLSEGLS